MIGNCLCLLVLLQLFSIYSGQRVAPGVPPQHYQQHVPQHAQMQQQQHVPNMQVNQPHMQQQMHQVHHGHHGQPHGQLLNTANIAHEKEHIAEHMEVPMDTSKMSEQELQFHYFKMHDADNNNKLDGCELIKSLIHWHEQGGKEKAAQGQVDEKIFKDDELIALIDPILGMDDGNHHSGQLITVSRLNELVRELDPTVQLDEEVEDTLLSITDDFVENVINGACLMAKHRHVPTVEVKDVQLYLERSFNMWIPGFGTDELRPYKRASLTEAHKQRLALIRRALKKY
ncbi:TBP-associated factor 12 [Carabus blaptoides fortunei]